MRQKWVYLRSHGFGVIAKLQSAFRIWIWRMNVVDHSEKMIHNELLLKKINCMKRVTTDDKYHIYIVYTLSHFP